MNSKLAYHRILLKLSGEALMGPGDFGLHQPTIERISDDIIVAANAGLSLAMVIGGGNIFRGVSGSAAGMVRAQADQMGMLATVMNALAMEDLLTRKGLDTRAMSAVSMGGVCETYTRRAALAHLKAGRAVICAGGTGNPFFTTDTAAALRAAELDCEALFKATQVDGVYSEDPKKNPDAERYDQLTYQDVLKQDLKVMDGAAIALSRETQIPVVVFSIHEKNSLQSVVRGEGNFTTVRDYET